MSATLVSRPWIGVLVGAAAFLAGRVRRSRILLTAGAPLALAFAAILDVPEQAWLAIGLLIADLIMRGMSGPLRDRLSGHDAARSRSPSRQDPVIRR